MLGEENRLISVREPEFLTKKQPVSLVQAFETSIQHLENKLLCMYASKANPQNEIFALCQKWGKVEKYTLPKPWEENSYILWIEKKIK